MIMTAREIRELSDEDLLAQLAEEKENLMKRRFQAASSQLTDVTTIRKAKRDIARLMTVLKERGLVERPKTTPKIQQ